MASWGEMMTDKLNKENVPLVLGQWKLLFCIGIFIIIIDFFLLRGECLSLRSFLGLMKIILMCCIPKEVVICIKSKGLCGVSFEPPHRVHDMCLSKIMILLDSSLKKCESCSFRKLIRNRNKAVKQSEFLLEVAEELSDCSFLAVIESEIGDLSCQRYDVMLCNI